MTEITLEEARLQRQQRRKQRRRRQMVLYGLLALVLFLAVIAVIIVSREIPTPPAEPQTPPQVPQEALPENNENQRLLALQTAQLPDWVDVQLIPINGAGRRGVALEDITAIVVHYVGNPGTTAQQNHDYYAQETTQVSSHFLIGLEGEIIQCLPLQEKSSATNHRNRDTISIEVCHPDDSGVFTEESYQALVKLTAWLCDLCGFDSQNIIRHYDVTEKICPKHFVEDESAWVKFLNDVDNARKAG